MRTEHAIKIRNKRKKENNTSNKRKKENNTSRKGGTLKQRSFSFSQKTSSIKENEDDIQIKRAHSDMGLLTEKREDCPICLEPLNSYCRVKHINGSVNSHKFHKDCILGHIQAVVIGNPSLCPLCREPIESIICGKETTPVETIQRPNYERPSQPVLTPEMQAAIENILQIQDGRCYNMQYTDVDGQVHEFYVGKIIFRYEEIVDNTYPYPSLGRSLRRVVLDYEPFIEYRGRPYDLHYHLYSIIFNYQHYEENMSLYYPYILRNEALIQTHRVILSTLRFNQVVCSSTINHIRNYSRRISRR